MRRDLGQSKKDYVKVPIMSRATSTKHRQALGVLLLALSALSLSMPGQAKAADLTLLFMGDSGHHQPPRRFQELAPPLAERGIELHYTDRMADLNATKLANYDGLVLYANIDRIEDDQAAAVLEFVASGKGFIPLHCATYCWRNNEDIVALMGGQFLRHGGEIFATKVAEPEHPIMQGYHGFTSWDETYIHHLHNEENRTVLEHRLQGEQAEGQDREPWTWIRTHGRGRVFYTAWGHDERTFNNRGFQNLVERGIRWACGDDPTKVPAFGDPFPFEATELTPQRKDVADFEFLDVGPKIPNYTPGANWGAQGAPKNLMQLPLSVEESMKHFVTPVGLAVRPYADERSFEAKPIAMTWDEQGRLWICETLDYPNELGGDRDRIRICEDTDGDHVADKFTVFAEGLSIPTAIAIFRDGAVVQNGTETIYLKDIDGDDVADQKTTLISNWALGDTHGGVSNFRYGLDNWIWAMQGYNNSSPKFEGGEAQTFRQGFWRFKLSQEDPPTVTHLEFVRSSDNNTWGLGISEEGLIFGSTANNNPSMFMPIPNRYYEKVRGWAPSTLHSIADTPEFDPITDKVRQVDQFGRYTAGAGHALYTARAFPPQWWNKTAFVCGPTGHLVGTFVLHEDGANYRSTSPINLLASDDEWSAPIMAEVGPDGAVWVLDWYNYIVQHNPTPVGFETGKGAAYESDLRDKRHGRIYRIVSTSESSDSVHEYTSLAAATNEALVEALGHPSFVWRLHAQRLLVERKANDVQDALIRLVRDDSVDEIGLNVAAIHALRTLDGLGHFTSLSDASEDSELLGALEFALEHPSAGVRRNAIAVVPLNRTGLSLLLDHQGLLRDPNIQVRLQAVLTLADMPTSDRVGSALVEAASRSTDTVFNDALTSAAATHASSYLVALGAWASDSGAGGNLEIARRVSEHVARGRPNAEELRRLMASLNATDESLIGAVLAGLLDGLPSPYQVASPSTLDQAIVDAFDSAPPTEKIKLVRLASICGTDALESHADEMCDQLMDIIVDVEADPQSRIEAAFNLVGFRSNDTEALEGIVAQLNAQTSPALARQFLRAIQQSDSIDAANAIIDVAPSLTPQLQVAAIDALLSRPNWALALVEGLEEGALDLSNLSLEQKQKLQSFPNEALREKATKLLAASGGLPDPDREVVLQSLLYLTEEKGDIDNGRQVFVKVCANCHKHGDLGKSIGPELTGMSVHPKEELLTHIIDPSRNVEGNFRRYTVLTLDGQVYNGMLSGESRTSLTLIDSEAKEINLAREDVDEIISSRKSVMPDGFEEQINKQELTDLLEFLTDKGRFVPIPIDRLATAISTKGLFSNNDQGPDRMIFPDWKPKGFEGIPFVLTDPQGKSKPNIILLNGPFGDLPPQMPKSVSMPFNTAAAKIHLLSGVGGWSFPYSREESVSMIVRLHYADGEEEDHELINGVHFADYIRRVDVPESQFAFALRGQQIRYLAISPERSDEIESVEFIKGPDNTAPMIMAITIETIEE